MQLLLDGVTSYLPSPLDINTTALDAAANEEEVPLSPSSDGKLAASSHLKGQWSLMTMAKQLVSWARCGAASYATVEPQW